MKNLFILGFICLLMVLLVVSCGQKETADTDESTSTAMNIDETITLDGTSVQLAGITFTPPSIWNDLGPSGMRQASYTFGPVKEDIDSATVTVFYFGQGMGGSIEANLSRWVGQMTLPEGVTPEEGANIVNITVNNFSTHILQINGSYNTSSGGMMMGESIVKENYRMVGVVLEALEGNIFFKLTGPVMTAEKMETALMTMVNGIK
jgi:hypothetical protein